jgi:deazaflavin-dependent oxidoreductase (nitroreductase family)
VASASNSNSRRPLRRPSNVSEEVAEAAAVNQGPPITSALQFSSGKLAPRNWVTLEVPGRRSGKPVTFPLVVADHEGEHYLVSMLGAASNWVANVRAAGGHAVIHHGTRENVLLTDVDVDARGPILRRYLTVAPGARPHMAVDPRAPLPDFDRVAAQYPVFHVTHDPSQQTDQPATVRTGSRLLGAGLILLGTAVATVAVLGPLVSGVLRYRRDQPTSVQYLTSPTAFWLVKFMDLGIVVPAAIAVGIGALRHRQWARKPMYTLVGAYTLIGASVTAMAITMTTRNDPDASATIVIGSTLMTALLAAITCYLYRPLFRRRPASPGTPDPDTNPPGNLDRSTA